MWNLIVVFYLTALIKTCFYESFFQCADCLWNWVKLLFQTWKVKEFTGSAVEVKRLSKGPRVSCFMQHFRFFVFIFCIACSCSVLQFLSWFIFWLFEHFFLLLWSTIKFHKCWEPVKNANNSRMQWFVNI